MILGEHSGQGLLGFVLQASESASTRGSTPTPSSHLQAAFPPTGPSGHAHGHLSRGHGAASHHSICAWGPQQPPGDTRGCPDTLSSPPSPGEDIPGPPPPWEEGMRGRGQGEGGRGEGKMSQPTWSDEGNRRASLPSHDGGWSQAHTRGCS